VKKKGERKGNKKPIRKKWEKAIKKLKYKKDE
jgi:hypothetical protein